MSGHDFSRAAKSAKRDWALAPAMARPARNAASEGILGSERIFFTTTKTCMAKSLLQSERNALLLIDVLRSYIAAGKFKLHDFVVMPNHVHLLIEVNNRMTIEKAMQLIKGGFSYRLKKEFGYGGGVATWFFRRQDQRCAKLPATSRIYRSKSCKSRTGRFSREISLLLYLSGKEKTQGLKPELPVDGTTEVVP